MSFPPASEQTLGLLAEVRANRSFVGGARRLVRPESPHRASLGTAFIGVGAALICGIRAIYGFSWFVAYWPSYENPLPALAAWVLLIIVLAAAFITASIVGDRLPDWMFAVYLVLLAAVIVLDLVAIWDLHDIGRYATASLTRAQSSGPRGGGAPAGGSDEPWAPSAPAAAASGGSDVWATPGSYSDETPF